MLLYSKLTAFYNHKHITNHLSACSLHFRFPPFSLGNAALLQKLRLAPLVMCEVGFYSLAGGDLFRNLWGLEMKPRTV